MNSRLPRIDVNRRWPWAALGYLSFCLLYTLTGTFHLRPPIALSPSMPDQWLPHIGWTIWVYHSQLFFLIFCIAVLRRPKNLSDAFYSMAFARLLSFAIFLLFPTTVPRPAQLAGGLTGKAYQFLYAIDS